MCACADVLADARSCPGRHGPEVRTTGMVPSRLISLRSQRNSRAARHALRCLL